MGPWSAELADDGGPGFGLVTNVRYCHFALVRDCIMGVQEPL